MVSDFSDPNRRTEDLLMQSQQVLWRGVCADCGEPIVGTGTGYRLDLHRTQRDRIACEKPDGKIGLHRPHEDSQAGGQA